jgi:hypothetical protein
MLLSAPLMCAIQEISARVLLRPRRSVRLACRSLASARQGAGVLWRDRPRHIGALLNCSPIDPIKALF